MINENPDQGGRGEDKKGVEMKNEHHPGSIG
jgi:hypothetical protein